MGVTIRTGQQIGALATTQVQAVKDVKELKKARAFSMQELCTLHEGKECAAYERDGLQAKLQRAEREQDRYVHAVTMCKAVLARCRSL